MGTKKVRFSDLLDRESDKNSKDKGLRESSEKTVSFRFRDLRFSWNDPSPKTESGMKPPEAEDCEKTPPAGASEEVVETGIESNEAIHLKGTVNLNPDDSWTEETPAPDNIEPHQPPPAAEVLQQHEPPPPAETLQRNEPPPNPDNLIPHDPIPNKVQSGNQAGYLGDLESLKQIEGWRRGAAQQVQEATEKNCEEVYLNLKKFLNSVKARAREGMIFDIGPASDLIARIIREPEMIRKIYPFTIPLSLQEDYNISHQVNTMIYAVKIGMGFSYSEKKLHELAMAALFHDVGMFMIPKEITNKYGKLSAADLDTIKKHPVIGKKILSEFRENPWLAAVAYEHHERENGQGYPRGLKGSEIHDYAKIVGIVDSYEAMTHNRPYRKALMQAFSARELVKSKNLLFSPSVIRVFLNEMSLYPLGSYVRLNNRAIGQVVGTDHARPLRPDIKLIFDGEGRRMEADVVVKLDENPIFFIQDSVSEEELPQSVNM